MTRNRSKKIAAGVFIAFATLIYSGSSFGAVKTKVRACARATSYEQERFLDAQENLEKIAEDANTSKVEIAQLINEHFRKTLDETSRFVQEDAGFSIKKIAENSVSTRAQKNIQDLKEDLEKLSQILNPPEAKGWQKLMKRFQKEKTESVEDVERTIRFHHFDARELRSELNSEVARLQRLAPELKRLQEKVIIDTELVRDFIESLPEIVTDASRAAIAQEVQTALTHALTDLARMESLLKLSIESVEQSIAENDLMIPQLDFLVESQISAATLNSPKALNLTARSRAQQLLMDLSEVAQSERMKIIENTIINRLTFEDLFAVLQTLPIQQQDAAYKLFKQKLSGRIDDHFIEQIVEMAQNVSFPIVADLIRTSGSKFTIAEIFRLQSKFNLSVDDLLSALPPRFESQSPLLAAIDQSTQLNLNESLALFTLLFKSSNRLPSYDSVELWEQKISAKIASADDKASFKLRVDTVVDQHGLKFERDLNAKLERYSGDPSRLIAEMETLLTSYGNIKLTPDQMMLVANAIPSTAVRPEKYAPGAEKYFEDIKKDIRANWMKRYPLSVGKDAFTATDLLHMDATLNVVLLHHLLRAMKGPASPSMVEHMRALVTKFTSEPMMVNMVGADGRPRLTPGKEHLAFAQVRKTTIEELRAFLFEVITVQTKP